MGGSEEGNSGQRDTQAKIKLYRTYSGNGKEFWHHWYIQGMKRGEMHRNKPRTVVRIDCPRS